MMKKQFSIREELKTIDKRLKTLDEHIKQAEYYLEFKPFNRQHSMKPISPVLHALCFVDLLQ